MTRYAAKVAAGDVLAGQWQRFACDRHLRDLAASEAGGSRWIWRPELAKKAFGIFSLFRHYKGSDWAGKPVDLEPWQRFIVGSLVGWVDADTGRRRFRNAFIELPRGQGKSTMAGGLLVILTFFDGEAGADGYSVATKKDQASITFQAGRQMVLRSPALRDFVTVNKYNLHSELTESKLEALGADADTLDGLRPHVAVADEVHKHPSADLIDVIESGMGTRTQPLLIEITTAGDDDASIYGQHALLTQRVLSRVVELDQWFGFIAAADPDDDWTDERTWKKANPNYGISVRPDFLKKECAKALANPAEQAKFRRLYLGQKANAVEAYLSVDDWRACPPLPDPGELARCPCVLGLDLSSAIDITAAVLVWKLSADEIAIRPTFWLPDDNLDNRGHRDRVPYGLYAEQGWLRLVPGNTIAGSYLRPQLVELARDAKATGVYFDPWHAAELVQNMQDDDGLRMLPVKQSFAMLSAPMKDLQAKILQRRVRHDHNPLMLLMVSNVVPRHDENGNVVPSKRRSRGRIDGVQATLNALTDSANPHPRPMLFFLGATHG